MANITTNMTEYIESDAFLKKKKKEEEEEKEEDEGSYLAVGVLCIQL